MSFVRPRHVERIDREGPAVSPRPFGIEGIDVGAKLECMMAYESITTALPRLMVDRSHAVPRGRVAFHLWRRPDVRCNLAWIRAD
jgi:hypothetical protein